MAIEPRTLQSGDVFSATFEDSNFRGGYFLLSAWSEGTWSDPLYLLESDANGGPATAVKMLDQDLEVQDYGVSGPGPDGLVLPSDITAGIWRICTANARDSACARFEVHARR